MKKHITIAVMALAMLFCLATLVQAADVQIEKTIKQIVFKKDKNGAEYARVIVSEPKTLNGVAYHKDVSVMAFGDVAKQLKGTKKGSTLKGIATESTFRGGTSYQLLQVLK